VKPTLRATLFTFPVFLFLAIAVPQDVIAQKSLSPATANGKHIFTQSCSVCHDTFGATPKSGPELRNYYRRQPRPTDAVVRDIIQQGKGKMPAFSIFNRSQIDDLIAYLKCL
jgi:mono/diheme cytochrome c family protein